MPRDQRLYMTFPNDFWMHPKVALLSVEAKWTFVEMNGYSRMQDLDGVIPAAMAHRMWDVHALSELVGSHPERPLVVYENDVYVIRDYAEHQMTTTSRDELSRKRSEAGTRGRAKQLSDKSRASARAIARQKPRQIRAEIETESEIETKKRKNPAASRSTQVPSNFSITDDMREWARANAPLVNLDAKLGEWIDYWTGVGKPQKDWVAVWRNGMRKQQEFAVRDLGEKKPASTRRVVSGRGS